ncbi:hypothetical protein EJB05_38200 [Eragrostis curvula]|uniref:Uncharacterized protein n=1 Tax=Eragrostis curvula TaxID=38414 RepID=A0A5J9TTK7_9POAL|nr:hypothetical protein EJB05_38200 [Eragrostis curvula]
MTTAPVLDLYSASDVPACDHKDRFVERQPRTTAQSTRLIMRSKTVMTAVLTVRSGLDPHMISGNGWVDLVG